MEVQTLRLQPWRLHTDPGSAMTEKPSFGETIKAKLEELDVEDRLEEVVNELGELVAQGIAKAGTIVRDHRGEIDALLVKASDAVDRSFDHKHTARIDSMRLRLEHGVDRIADYRPHPHDEGPTDSSAQE
jgi:hypothetical protein